jgi:hypothetical protein
MTSARWGIDDVAGIRASDLGLNCIEITPVTALKFVPVPKQAASQDDISIGSFIGDHGCIVVPQRPYPDWGGCGVKVTFPLGCDRLTLPGDC